MLPIIPLVAAAIKAMVIEKVTNEMEENIEEAVNDAIEDVAEKLDISVDEVKAVAEKVKKVQDLHDMINDYSV